MQIEKSEKLILDSISPVFAGEKVEISPSKKYPRIRLQNRFLFRNERNLYHSKSALSGKNVITVFDPTRGYKILDQSEWWGDGWSALDYGRDFDFSKTFTEQFKELSLEIPHLSLFNTGCENSYYTNFTIFSKNCYLCFGVTESEDCQHSRFIRNCNDCIDCLSIANCELCYETINSQNCYNSSFLNNCRDCTNSLMLEDCQSCSDCILCFGLYKKKFCIQNEYVGREKFEDYKRKLFPLTRNSIKFLESGLLSLKQTSPHRASHIYNSENCTGDQVWDSKDCHFAFDVSNGEGSQYVQFSPNPKFSQDCTYNAPQGVEHSYQCCSTIAARTCMGLFLTSNLSDSYYSMESHSSSNIFGCIGIRNKSYCIFNKQYSKSEYEKLALKIARHMVDTGEWGEFFDPSLSCFGYNETVAHEYFPLSKTEAIANGFNWNENLESRNSKDKKQLLENNFKPAPEVPKSSVVDDSYRCSKTGRAFKFNKSEISFYSQIGLPLPELCPEARHYARIDKQGSIWQWERTTKDGLETFWTNHEPDSEYEVLPNQEFLELQRG